MGVGGIFTKGDASKTALPVANLSSNPEEEKRMKAGFLHKIGGQEICDLYEDFNKLASPLMYKTQIVWHFC